MYLCQGYFLWLRENLPSRENSRKSPPPPPPTKSKIPPPIIDALMKIQGVQKKSHEKTGENIKKLHLKLRKRLRKSQKFKIYLELKP